MSSGDSLKTIDISVYESDTTSNVPQGFIRNTTWYEGIGSQTYILEPMFDYLIGFEHITNLYCYRDTVQGIQYEPFIVFNVDTGIHCDFDPPISIREFAEKQEDVLIYPNPFSDKFFIESSGKILGSTFQIYDLQGKLMYEGIIYEQKTQIYTDKLSSGFYLVKIQNDHVIFTRKLFKP
ncbi:MAG: T9SS type A sorting domain-containing protein [Cryomorphaceae bacterium]|nr:T9SS type A sorting domain-containing protein [Cryomorphaceae bacterium]